MIICTLLPKTKIARENRPSQEERISQPPVFKGELLVSVSRYDVSPHVFPMHHSSTRVAAPCRKMMIQVRMGGWVMGDDHW